MNFRFDTDLLLSVLAIVASTLILWLLLVGAGRQIRKRFEAVLRLAVSTDDAQRASDMASRRLTALRLLLNAAKYALVICALMMILRRLNVPLDSLLLPAGFLGVGLGLGAQNLVRDILAGLFIVFEGQLAVGDVVRIDNIVGAVEQIGLRVTTLRDEGGHIFYITNGAIGTVEKFPRQHALLLCVPVAPAAAQEPRKVKAASAVIAETIRRFDRDYRILSGGTTAEELAQEGDGAAEPADDYRTLCFRLPVRPLHETVMREKLPPRIAAALEANGYMLAGGAEIVVLDVSPATGKIVGQMPTSQQP